MLGNWSLGDYFKKEAIEWSFEFLTGKQWLGIPKERLAVTCFAGDKDAPRDNEAAGIWLKLGMPKERIAFLPKEDNWWGPAGETGPCGPDTEMFFWAGKEAPPKVYDPKDKRWVEIWNDVFMQYSKTKDGRFEPLKQRNVDTGLGVERVAMALQGKSNIFETELFAPIIDRAERITKKRMDESNKKSFRIIADHMRAAVFILGDERGVVPSNTDQGYILRRYIRRVVRHLMLLGMDQKDTSAAVEMAKTIISIYGKEYPLLEQKKDFIFSELQKEQEKFQRTLANGLRGFERMCKGDISGKDAFLLFQSFGFPIEMTEEMAGEKGVKVDVAGFKAELERHQALSRAGAEMKFKGGLSEATEATAKLHTATHLLNEALRQVVSKDIRQKGSNITPERLRFDFNFDRKLTPEEIKKAEDWVNARIREKIPVSREDMKLEKAKASGAQSEFGVRYPETVSVYSVGKYSKEICMGPHVKNTSELGKFRIAKEESSAAGIRRIKAVLE
jgi:alanyl-tRNA synthetase